MKLVLFIIILLSVRAEPCFIFDRKAFSKQKVASSSRSKVHLSNHDGEEVTDAASLMKQNVVGRRQWFRVLGLSGAAANAAAAFATEAATMLSAEDDVSVKVCDKTVESYKKGGRHIHIVGTAHVSSASAALSGGLVKEVKPEGVFIELDTQRASRAFRNGVVSKPIDVLFFVESNPDGGGSVTLQSASIQPKDMKRSVFLSNILDKIAQNPIQQMYQGLESQGITPGEEFITAVEEGTNIGSVIILGDRRMDYTMRRIAKALVLHTDPKKLVEADRIITSKMKERMPELNEWEDQKKVLTADEFQFFVERMKTKESTNEFMSVLRKAAPELYEALVAERDVFMARGLNALLSLSLPSAETGGRSLHSIVAVIGLGHVHGVGKELQSLGWSPYTPQECRRI